MSISDLFGADAPANERDSDDAAGPLVLTNAANLSYFLSLGYIGPYESFGPDDKYYGDFLDAAPGRIPLFRGPLNRDLIDHVRRDSRNAARPVVLELRPDALPLGEVPTLDTDGHPVEAPAADLNASVAAPPLVLPFAAVRRVIFLSEEDRDEVMLNINGLGNVPPIEADSVSVSQGVIGDTGLGLKAVLPWLGDLDDPQALTWQAFHQLDRTAGAVTLTAYARPDLEESLLAFLLPEPSDFELPDWLMFATGDAADEVDTDPDALTFAAAVSVLRASSPGAWRPREVLEDVWTRLAESDLPKGELDDLEKAINKIRGILTNEIEFAGSTSTRYPALQGLMLFLIRHEPTPLLQWDPEETRAGADAHLAAAAYAGLFHGHAKLPLTLRDPGRDRRIAETLARSLSPLTLPTLHAGRARPPEREETADRDLVGLLLEADLTVDGPYRRAAVDLCGYMDWKDCVTSYVVFPDSDEQSPAAQYTSTGSKYNNRKLTTWTVPGVVELRYELDVDTFLDHLRSEDVSERDKKRVHRMLIDVAQN